MNLSFRVLAAVCILILAAAGCQKGKHAEGTRRAGSKAESSGAGSKGGKTHAKAEARGTATAASGHEGGAGGSHAGSRSTLTAGDDGSSLDLRQGQVVTVVLESNRSSGLKWILADLAGTVI